MSDVLHDAKDEQIKKLYGESLRRKEKVRTYAELNQKLKAERDEATALLAKYQKELDELRQAPDAIREERDRLKGELRQRDHKDVFGKVASEFKVRPEAVDDLWKLSGYTADSDEVNVEHLKGLVSQAVQSRPWLVVEGETTQTKQEPPLQPGPGYSRGSVQVDHGFRVRRTDMQDPAWMAQNHMKIAEARKENRLVIDESA